MANEKLEIGSPPAAVVDYATSSLLLYYRDPGDAVTLWDIWDEKLKDINSCQLYLSGGIDSQFSASVLTRFGIKFSAHICDLRWNGITVNAHDVLTAIRYAETHDFPYHVFVMDIQEFFESEEYVDVALKYRTASPQIATHLRMLELTASDTVVFGGDMPIIRYNPVTEDIKATNTHKGFFLNNLSPYYNLGNDRGLPVYKDFFKLDSYTNYLSVKFNLDVIQTHKKYFAELSSYQDSSFFYKQLYYKLLGASIMSPLYKATGFETLKIMLAQETGIYNQFDKLYRHPLQTLISSQKWASNLFNLEKTAADRNIGNLSSILTAARDLIIDNNCEPCNAYKFDF